MSNAIPAHEALQQFREAMAARGILPSADLLADGKIHRCDAEGKGGKGDASYLLHPDGIPAGGFQNWRDGIGWQDWRANIGRTMTPAEKAAQDARIAQAQAARKAEEAKRNAEAQAKAAEIWQQTISCTSHPYLARKGIAGAYGVREYEGKLVIPVRDTGGNLHGLQFIGADGEDRDRVGDGRLRGRAG